MPDVDRTMWGKAWVLLPDNGCEGLGEPVCVWLDEASARRDLALIDWCAGGYRLLRLVEVPLSKAMRSKGGDWPGGA